jgi:multiple antibiotic resistance protein
VDTTFQHYLLAFYAVGNNIAALPMHMNLCKGLDKAGQHRLSAVATGASLATMAVSFFFGAAVLDFFGISIAAFRIAGGLYLVTSGLVMLKRRDPDPASVSALNLSEVIPLAVVPIAIPLTCGPGVISAIIVYVADTTHLTGYVTIGAAILCVALANYLTFFFSPAIIRFLGHVGMDIFIKLFGLIIMALGIQFCITGLTSAFPVLGR